MLSGKMTCTTNSQPILNSLSDFYYCTSQMGFKGHMVQKNILSDSVVTFLGNSTHLIFSVFLGRGQH